MLRRAALFLGPLAAVALSGCLYTGPINYRPVARIQSLTPAPHYKGYPVVFSADTSEDRDGDTLTASWRLICQGDLTPCKPYADPVVKGIDEEYEIPALPKKGQMWVDLVVSDPLGATSEDRVAVDVENRNPAVTLQLPGPVLPDNGRLVGQPIDIYAQPSDPDGDPVSLTWKLYPPSASVPAQVKWTKIATDHHRLTPDVPGQWQVEVTASDGDGGTAVAKQTILVDADHPPCIDSTSPEAVAGATYILDRDSGPRVFSVLHVADDLDPYPPRPDDPLGGEASFRWFVSSPASGGDLVEVDGHDEADLEIDPGAFAPGDQIEVRVEVSDRNDRPLPCGPDQPTCSLSGDSCLQRVSWNAEVR